MVVPPGRSSTSGTAAAADRCCNLSRQRTERVEDGTDEEHREGEASSTVAAAPDGDGEAANDAAYLSAALAPAAARDEASVEEVGDAGNDDAALDVKRICNGEDGTSGGGGHGDVADGGAPLPRGGPRGGEGNQQQQKRKRPDSGSDSSRRGRRPAKGNPSSTTHQRFPLVAPPPTFFSAARGGPNGQLTHQIGRGGPGGYASQQQQHQQRYLNNTMGYMTGGMFAQPQHAQGGFHLSHGGMAASVQRQQQQPPRYYHAHRQVGPSGGGGVGNGMFARSAAGGSAPFPAVAVDPRQQQPHVHMQPPSTAVAPAAAPPFAWPSNPMNVSQALALNFQQQGDPATHVPRAAVAAGECVDAYSATIPGPVGPPQDGVSYSKSNPTQRVRSPNGNADKSPTGRPPICLHLVCDADSLSPYQCLLRKQIEIFEALRGDTETNAQGRNRPIVIGQVGIRCRHCSSLPYRQRARGAVYFPARLAGLYQAAQNMAVSHLAQRCPLVPVDVRSKLTTLRERKSSAGGGKKYWAEGVRVLGVFEDGDGLRFEER